MSSSASRPVYHFTAAANWLNDPNGLVFADGAYHLFYQHHPHDNTFGAPHWGHASSTDLVRWRHHPIALEPDELGEIYSGSAVVDQHNTTGFGAGSIVAVFTHHLEAGVERQSLAYSADGGETWTKYRGNPVLEAPDGAPDFRDPRVLWWEGAEGGHWVMLLAAGTAVWVYRSDNLIDWSFSSAFTSRGASGRVWECPDLFCLPVGESSRMRWVLSVAVDHGDGPELSGTRYFVGDFDGERFTETHEAVHWADHGADFYAAQSWSAAPGQRKVWIGWMNNWGYAREAPTEGWRGAMSIPRDLGLMETDSGIRLTQLPVPEVERWRRPLLRTGPVEVTSTENLLEGLRGTSLDIEALIDLDRSSATELRLSVRVGAAEATEIVLNLAELTLSVDRIRSGEHLIHRHYAGPRLASIARLGQLLSLRVLVDVTSVEVFAGDGLVVITEQVFPLAGSDRASLEAVDGVAFLRELEVHAIEVPTT